MSSICIEGGYPLSGCLKTQGSKNAALPILAASVLHKGITRLINCPQISDVDSMIEILKKIGCIVTWERKALVIDATNITSYDIPDEYTKRMRSSFILLGPLLGRRKKAIIAYPGGCSIGVRPVNIHIDALEKLNISIVKEESRIIASTKKIQGNTIRLPYPSVGATQNCILAAVYGHGTTEIYNCAKEPEVVELCKCLNQMGAKIRGLGRAIIRIDGVKKLHDTEFEISADRIAAGTYLTAAAITKGEITLTHMEPFHLTALLEVLIRTGCQIKQYMDAVELSARNINHIRSIDLIKTGPYPEFPTDMQSQIMSLLMLADGTSIIKEMVFEDRFKTAYELEKMGANIKVEGKNAIVQGVSLVKGARVEAHDLRGGAALVIAGLAAQGTSRIEGFPYIERGYEGLCDSLEKLGAHICLVSD
ncbi:MAG: UDP-N-acetylglucosamine 1-carboxyvinyltransferase [Clostridiales bacterium]|nr:UDP-N-acetylglucosamine 1-carboxyvinyltransferase [Clostridiales bacterium]